MYQRLRIPILVLATFFICQQDSYSQRAFINSRLNTSQFKQDRADKTQIINGFEGRSRTGSVDIFTFNLDVLKDSFIIVNIFAGSPLIAVRDEIVERSVNDFTWHGHIQGPNFKEGSLVLVAINGVVSGNLNYKAKNYAIHPMGKGLLAIYEIDFSKYPQEDAPGMDLKTSKLSTSSTMDLPAPSCNLRVLVVFTPSAESNIINTLGYPNIQQFAQQAIAESNQGFLNSNVTYRMELAAAIRASYTESGDYPTDLGRFAGTTDGYMDAIHAYRDKYTADVCVLIFNNSAFCGQADEIQATASTAFVVVHYGCALGYYSFAHEIGHLHGCRHDPAKDPTTTPYAYGHGYVYTAGGWRTIMAYATVNNETRLQYYSNPNVTYGGVAMGTSLTNYNARVLNQTIGTVAAFRSASSSLTLDNTVALTNYEVGDAQATTSITMQPGFQATSGSKFNAYIKNCTDLVNGSSINSRMANTGMDAIKPEDNAKSGQLRIYPDPSSGMINISAGDVNINNTTIVVNDQGGKRVYTYRNDMNKNNISLDLGFLANGVYYLTIMSSTQTLTKKIIISK